jgi:biotin operon repressor
MNLKNIVSQATAARMLGISRAAVADLIKRGRLRTAEIDGVPHIYKSDVLNFQRQKPGPKPRAQGQARS